MPLPLGPDIPPPLADLIRRLRSPEVADAQPSGHIWVAVSGGLDSTLLLLCAAWYCPGRVRAIHVDHQLQAESALWSERVQALCAQWDLPCEVRQVDVQPGGSLEDSARQARYRVFADLLAMDDQLLMAHHQDDQLETLIFRLCRGSGLEGLAGMPARRALGQGTLWRPWLDVPRADLRAAADAVSLDWQEDPSNADLRFDRNFIRHRILPELRQRWPGVDGNLVRSQTHMAQAAERLRGNDQQRLAGWMSTQDGSLCLEGLTKVPEDQALVRLWLHRQGLQPSQVQLEHLMADVALAAPDARGELVVGATRVRRYQGRLYAVPRLSAAPEAPLVWSTEKASELVHPAMGRLRAERVEVTAERADHVLALGHWAGAVEVRFRQGGEHCHPAGRAKSRDLKRLLQEAGVPPWWRSRMPLIYIQGELAAVGDLFVCVGWAAEPGETGMALHWQRPSA